MTIETLRNADGLSGIFPAANEYWKALWLTVIPCRLGRFVAAHLVATAARAEAEAEDGGDGESA